ncbi:Uncharacterised protein [BD1-7 clade bacterium]|nr:Uncharacterised protein [BD1-7 clade bacterium]
MRKWRCIVLILTSSFFAVCVQAEQAWIECSEDVLPPLTKLEKTSLLNPDKQYFKFTTANLSGTAAVFNGDLMKGLPMLTDVPLLISSVDSLEILANNFEVRILQSELFLDAERLAVIEGNHRLSKGYLYHGVFEDNAVPKNYMYGIWLEVIHGKIKLVRVQISGWQTSNLSSVLPGAQQVMARLADVCALHVSEK